MPHSELPAPHLWVHLTAAVGAFGSLRGADVGPIVGAAFGATSGASDGAAVGKADSPNIGGSCRLRGIGAAADASVGTPVDATNEGLWAQLSVRL